jgi:type III pantothenate kinase
MANLVIDIGNSRTKLAVFNNRQISHLETFDLPDLTAIDRLIRDFQISNSILSSVAGSGDELEELMRQKTNYIRFSAREQRSVTLTYQTPQTLGLDRLAGIIAAHALYPKQNCMVIDAGTCITYDSINAEGIYSGGSISPGLSMRFKAMHTFTGRLPVVSPELEFTDWQGNDTVSAMVSGVQNGVFYEVRGFIENYTLHYPELRILLCGGDANFFDTRLKSSIFAHSCKTEPQLVLIGLNEVIYQQND